MMIQLHHRPAACAPVPSDSQQRSIGGSGTSTVHLTLKCWIGRFLSRLRRCQTLVPLVPLQGQPTNLCSNRLFIKLRHPRGQRDPNQCPSILCNSDWLVCLACRRAHPFREILPFLPRCSSTLSFVFVFAFALARLALALAFVFAFAFACLFCSIRFSFDSLPPYIHRFHTMNSFLGTLTLDCPSPTDKSAEAVCFFVPIQSFLSASSVQQQVMSKSTPLQTPFITTPRMLLVDQNQPPLP